MDHSMNNSDQIDQALIQKAVADNVQIKRLYNYHRDLDEKIAALDSRGFLTEPEKLKMKQLKKEKLRGKDELQKLIDEYKSSVRLQ